MRVHRREIQPFSTDPVTSCTAATVRSALARTRVGLAPQQIHTYVRSSLTPLPVVITDKDGQKVYSIATGKWSGKRSTTVTNAAGQEVLKCEMKSWRKCMSASNRSQSGPVADSYMTFREERSSRSH